MPIYIVRWNNPDPAVCLVRAPSKAATERLMDSIYADPSYCEIKEYKGFLVVNIDLGVKSHQEEVSKSCVPHTVVDDVGECLDDPEMDVSLEPETKLDILKMCFPHYDDYFGQRVDDLAKRKEDRDDQAAVDECKKAIQQDFDYMERKIRAKLEPPPKGAVDEAEDILRQSSV